MFFIQIVRQQIRYRRTYIHYTHKGKSCACNLLPYVYIIWYDRERREIEEEMGISSLGWYAMIYRVSVAFTRTHKSPQIAFAFRIEYCTSFLWNLFLSSRFFIIIIFFIIFFFFQNHWLKTWRWTRTHHSRTNSWLEERWIRLGTRLTPVSVFNIFMWP